MKAIELVGEIDDQHRLKAQVPEELPVGPVRLIVFVSEENDAGSAWTGGIGREWADEMADSRQGEIRLRTAKIDCELRNPNSNRRCSLSS